MQIKCIKMVQGSRFCAFLVTWSQFSAGGFFPPGGNIDRNFSKSEENMDFLPRMRFFAFFCVFFAFFCVFLQCIIGGSRMRSPPPWLNTKGADFFGGSPNIRDKFGTMLRVLANPHFLRYYFWSFGGHLFKKNSAEICLYLDF